VEVAAQVEAVATVKLEEEVVGAQWRVVSMMPMLCLRPWI
jgi:hypothetical protein